MDWHAWIMIAASALGASLLAACAPRPGTEAPRRGDEIVVCGRMFHTGAPVVLWTDPGGYDAYRTEQRFAPWPKASWQAPATPPTAGASGPGSPNRFGIRFAPGSDGCPLSPVDFERIRGGGWDLETLRRCVDQFVLHYDVCGVSRECFRTLQDSRGLSVHFMLDIDGTIYQTMDVKEKAWHATTSNDRSVGVEIANVGAYADDEKDPFAKWFRAAEADASDTIISIPPELGDGGVRTKGFIGRPASRGPVVGHIQGRTLRQHDLTEEQYRSLAALTAALCTVLPGIPCDYPRAEHGGVLNERMDDAHLATYHGLLGHYHLQSNKVDPGPAMQWDRVVDQARSLMRKRRPEPPPGSTGWAGDYY